MRHWAHYVRAGSLALALALLGNLAAPALALAETAATLSQHMARMQRSDVQDGGDGSLKLLANAPPAPTVYGSFKHFGLAISSAQHFSTPFRSLQIDYAATTPAGSSARVDARVSADGQRWSGWEIDLASGARVSFAQAALFAQYRVTLLANDDTPSVRVAQLTPLRDPARYTAMADAQPVAPTWKVHATRQGMIGGRTANGHRITKRDHFVSLPSWRSLAPNGTNDYTVRITYNGRTSVAPVYDVGPWNAHDDYWNEQRQRYADLPRGYPEDHAAYFDGYNGGRAEQGRVRFPTAIDIGDGAWWDDLGIKGDRAVVEVTFLWLGSDPLAALPAAEPAPPAAAPPPPVAEPPPPAAAPPPPVAEPPPPAVEPPPPAAEPPPPAAEPTAEPAPPAAVEPTPAVEPPPPAAEPPPPAAEAPPPTAEPTPPPAEPPPTAEPVPPAAESVAPPVAVEPPPPAPPVEVVVDERASSFKGNAKIKWYDGPKDCGVDGSALWTFTTANADESENTGRWQPALPDEALYDVYVAIPNCAGRKPNTGSARYLIQHRDGTAQVVVDQDAKAGDWVLLGRFPFSAGEGGFVELRDVADDQMRTIWFDAVKWVRAP
jgi:hypothetical protein